MAIPTSIVLGETVVMYTDGGGNRIPALVEGTDGANPPVLSLFVGPGSYHLDGVVYGEEGDQGTWNFNAADSFQTEALTVSKAGDVGDQTDPAFTFTIENAGINEPELRIDYTDDDEGPIKVFGLEKTGTLASVRATRGSHFEGFVPDHTSNPVFRLNSYPEGKMLLELGPGGTYAAAGDMVRETDVVTVTTAWPHGFSTGDTVTLDNTVGGTDGEFAADEYVVTVTGVDEFTFEEEGEDEESTGIGYFSAPTDTFVSREATNHMGFGVDGARKFSIYADSMTTEDGIRLATAGSLETSKIVAIDDEDSPYTAGVVYGIKVDNTAGNVTVALPAASACAGRHYLITQVAGANDTIVDAAGADTISGDANVTLTAQWDYVKIVSDGVATWLIEGSVVTP